MTGSLESSGPRSNKEVTPDKSNSLRDRAEAATHRQSLPMHLADSPPATIEHFQTLIHELNVHQIELEMQNEELRRIQSALEDSRTRYLDLYDHAPVGYIQVNAAGVIQESNETIAAWLGVQSHEIKHKLFSQCIFEEDRHAFLQLRADLFESGEPKSCELRLVRRDGAHLWVQLSGTMVSKTSNNRSLRIALVDISERKRVEATRISLEAQLRQSQKMEPIGTLAGGIAHDFNNILALILAQTELATANANNPQSTVTNIDEIHRAAERARSLVKQVLAFSRLQQNDRAPIDLALVVEDSARLLQSTLPSRISLTIDCEHDVPTVVADFTQLEQVILNIATNSLHAIKGRAGNIHMRLDTVSLDSSSTIAPRLLGSHWTKQSKAVRLTIQDNGSGMPPEVLDRVFEPFFTSKPADEGTGLGLAVAHGIIQSHQGEITAESKLGQGATFTIYLPPADLAANDSASLPAEPVANRLQRHAETAAFRDSENFTILYLDDNIVFVKSICVLLKNYGLNVVGFTDQQAALDAILTSPEAFDVVVTDYNMPGLSGLDVARQIRLARPNLPVVLTSGFIDKELCRQVAEIGVKEVISKPFESNEFIALLSRFKPSR